MRKYAILMAVLGGCMDVGTTTSEQGLVTTDLATVRSQYGITAFGVASRKIGIVSATQYATLASDLLLARPPSLPVPTTPSVTFAGAPSPQDDGYAEATAAAVQYAYAGCPACTIEVYFAPNASGTALFAAMQAAVSDAPKPSEIVVVQSISEADPMVGAISSLVTAHQDVLFLGAADDILPFPASHAKALRVAATEIPSFGIDHVWSGSLDACSTLVRDPAEPALCGANRMSSDVAGVGRSVKVAFKGATITTDSRFAPVGLWAGRVALSPAAMPSRLQLLNANVAFRRDVPTGTSGTGHTAIPGVDLATGIGVPLGNVTF